MYNLSTSCLIFFFLFSLFHHLPCASSKCDSLFQCGNITAGFPFWGGNRHKHCGFPSLELRCIKNITSLFISSQEFYVLHLNHTSNTITLARTDLFGSICNSTFTTTTLPPEIFELSPTYKSLTVFYYSFITYTHYLPGYICPMKGLIIVSENPDQYHNICGDTFTLNVPTSFVGGEKELNMTNLESVLSKGFEVKVKINDLSCQECLSSHGSCGFNETFPLGATCSPLNPPPPTSNSCESLFQCGNITAGFPFWGGNRRKHCGHPLLELSCNQNNSTSLFISDQEYYVLHVDQTSYNLTLARDLLDFFAP
ncbi:unnamed protein product [Arabidopsis halleri]